jgi:hypothetical protein
MTLSWRRLESRARHAWERLTPPAAGPVAVETRHLTPSVAAQVEAWFEGRIAQRQLSGERSVIIAHPDDPQRRLKIKGAGLLGGPVRLGDRQRSGLLAPRFDFEGRMMHDVASSHDNAPRGGASFQQAAVEFEMSRVLAGLGYRVVPCLGFGRLTGAGGESWFIVFDWDPAWESIDLPHFPIARFAETALRFGGDLLELAGRHGLVSNFWYVAASEGEPLIKDLHPFQQLRPVSHSRISWTMHVFYAMHLAALPAILRPSIRDALGQPADLQVQTFRAALPDVTVAEHEALRWALVAPYMRRPPRRFDPRALRELLLAHRLTRAIMERCPEGYAEP